MSLRLKLLLAASLLLAVPVAGYRFVLAMETFLRANQVAAASDAARTLAAAVEKLSDALPDPVRKGEGTGPELYVHPLAVAPTVDGYDADWAELATHRDDRPQVRAGLHGRNVFLLLRLADADRAGALRLLMEDAPGFRRAWLLQGNGVIAVREVPPASGRRAPAHRDTRILAAAQRSGGGLVLELRAPIELVAPRLAFERLAAPGADTRDNPQGNVPASGAFELQIPPPELQRALETLRPRPGRRLRVIDASGRVVAQAGALLDQEAQGSVETLLQRLLDAEDEPLLSLAPDTLRLDGAEIQDALAGTPSARLRRDRPEDAVVVSAAHPLRGDATVRGALVLEESTSAITALAQAALLELFVVAAMAFLVAIVVLLTVSGRMVARLRALRDEAQRAVDEQGRVHGHFDSPGGDDEIGDLARSFGSAVERLRGYQDYLEQLAQRLSHELRTPLAVIRTSLENLASDVSVPPSVGRAREGVERLEGLIRRMSEATRLEQAMSDTRREPVDLALLAANAAAVQGAIEGATPLELERDPDPVRVEASPELLLQALDKLLSNARDFAREGTSITVTARRHGSVAELSVHNHGPGLPPGPTRRLFDSMVSERNDGGAARRAEAEPHLGLGLHVVRLIARFHGGEPFAEECRDHAGAVTGVRIGLRMPCSAGHAAP